jgi:hypothetical protein
MMDGDRHQDILNAFAHRMSAVSALAPSQSPSVHRDHVPAPMLTAFRQRSDNRKARPAAIYAKESLSCA